MMHNFAVVATNVLNYGLYFGFFFAALILLRPVTGRLLRPKHQVTLWGIGWGICFFIYIASYWGARIPIPVSFRTLILPRIQPLLGESRPMYLPIPGMDGEAGTLVLPLVGEFPISFNETLLAWAGIVWTGVLAVIVIVRILQERRLRSIGRAGRKMTDEEMRQYGVDYPGVVVRLCRNLPTSFVRSGSDRHFGDAGHVICLQEKLPRERMRLVLRHELAHIELNHLYYRSYLLFALAAFWWNPILWLAFRLHIRDMELACDEAVIEKLDGQGRREYARTLVELASGQHLWGGVTSFGECDAAIRVKRVTAWRDRGKLYHRLSLVLTVLLVLFFYCGGPIYRG